MPTTIDQQPPSPPDAAAPTVPAAPYWPALLVTAAVTLAPALLLRESIGVLAGGGGATVLDGALLPGPTETAGAAGTLVLAAGWIAAVTAGTAVAAGGQRGLAVSPWAALRLAGRKLPWLGLMLLLIGIAGTGLLVAAVLALNVFEQGRPEGWTGVVLVLLLLAQLVLATRLLVIPAALLGDGAGPRLAHAHALASGRLLRTGATITLGGLLVPAILVSIAGSLAESVPAAAVPSLALALVASTALQSSSLAHAYLRQRPVAKPGPQAALDEVDHRLSGLAAPAPPARAAVAGAVAFLLAPALLGVAVAVVNPYGSPRATRHDVSWSGEVLAAAWPAGGHPVVVTSWGPHWCLDDACASVRSRQSEPLMLGGPYGATAIGTDGSVLSAGIRGRAMPAVIITNGDDAVQLQRCTAPWGPVDSRPRPGSCEDGITRWHSGGEEAESQLAVAAGTGGTIVVATARPLLPERAGGPERVQLAVTRCNTVHCTTRSLRVLTTLPMSLTGPVGASERSLPAPLLRLTVDAQDRPAVLLRDPAGRIAHLAACTSAACDDARISQIPAPEDGAAPAVLITGGDGTQRLVAGPSLHGPGVSPAAAVAGDAAYGLDVERVPRFTGGGTARLVLWQCPADPARPARRTVLPSLENGAHQVGLTVAPDGRAFVTYADNGNRYALLVTGSGKETKGAYCRGFAG
ncbi:hypothetical protein [Catellatospora sp. NPDC049609]|uniref:hypothetical protein n=1 Tax=Catellatospora sp. NPDC049609 TaxID=3155505 RepID=UPI0034336C6A